MTHYKVDVIGEQGLDTQFDEISEAFDHIKHLLNDGKTVEIAVAPEVPVEAPVEGEGAPTTTEPPTDTAPADLPEADLPETPDTQDTDVTDEPATDPKDADIDATDDIDEDDDTGVSGEDLDAGDDDDLEPV